MHRVSTKCITQVAGADLQSGPKQRARIATEQLARIANPRQRSVKHFNCELGEAKSAPASSAM